MFWHVVSKYEEGVLMALLQMIESGQHIVAACTHLWYDPRHPDVKVAQADMACKAVVQFIHDTSHQHSRAPAAAPAGDADESSDSHEATNTVNHDAAAADDGDDDTAAADDAASHAGRIVDSMPVVIAGDFNSLWKKYKGDVFDHVSPFHSSHACCCPLLLWLLAKLAAAEAHCTWLADRLLEH